jgi:hypothetical protein
MLTLFTPCVTSPIDQDMYTRDNGALDDVVWCIAEQWEVILALGENGCDVGRFDAGTLMFANDGEALFDCTNFGSVGEFANPQRTWEERPIRRDEHVGHLSPNAAADLRTSDLLDSTWSI